MATKIITKNSSTTTAIPTTGDLVQGELAVNVTDKRLFTENASGAIVELGTNPSTLDVTGAATFSGSVGIAGQASPTYKLDGGFADQTWGWHLNSSYNAGFTFNTTERSLLIHTKSAENIDHIKFATSSTGAEAMRISNGNLLVGTTTALGNGGTTISNDGYVYASNDNTALYLNRQGIDGAIAEFRKAGTTVGSWQSRAGLVSTLILDPRAGGMGITGGGVRFTPTDNTGTEQDARNDIGSSTYRFKDLYLSGTVNAGAATFSGDVTVNSHLEVQTGGVGETASFGGDDASGARALQIIASTTTGLGDTHTLNATSVSGVLQFATQGLTRLTISSTGTATFSGNIITNGNVLMGVTTSSLALSGGTASNVGANILCYGSTHASLANILVFRNSASEAARIDASGNLLVGTTTTAYTEKLSIGMTSGNQGLAIKQTDNANANDKILFINTNGIVGYIRTTGSATSYTTSSDYRLKEDDVPMTGATERVKALRPINFAWKADGSRTDGFLAHEAQEVVPECATGTKDAMRDEEYEVTPAVEEVRDEDDNVTTEAVAAVMGTRSVPDYQGIDQSKLVPLLTATIQELIARIEALEGA